MGEQARTDEQIWDDALADAAERAEFGEGDRWHFLLDPAWAEEDDPPTTAVVGGWLVDGGGETALFRANPSYRPSRPGLPTDPADAALQLAVEDRIDGAEVLERLSQVVLALAVDEEGRTVVTKSPDDVLSVLVATSPAHQRRVPEARWLEVTVDELADELPESGLDVLLNPGAPASMRIEAGALKDAFATGAGRSSDEQEQPMRPG
ncbi:type VII secretion system-associated protein [Saccharopolyspora gregorii]|uniref:Type VII secretion system-associated protein n=1 Tax=Saccharopolyspora gregorii TaxID=33914 RepID=A0ABP6RW97_9PSEU|nr:type VII secretion system-associated protein [Saccharopolyspora gregorii]